MKYIVLMMSIALMANAAHAERLQRGERAKHIKERLHAMDHDGSGSLSQDEFKGRDERFKKADVDGNGNLTKGEIKADMKRHRNARVKNRFDADNNGEVSKEEYKTRQKWKREKRQERSGN